MPDTETGKRAQEIEDFFMQIGLGTEEERERFTKMAKPQPWENEEDFEVPSYLTTHNTMAEEPLSNA